MPELSRKVLQCGVYLNSCLSLAESSSGRKRVCGFRQLIVPCRYVVYLINCLNLVEMVY